MLAIPRSSGSLSKKRRSAMSLRDNRWLASGGTTKRVDFRMGSAKADIGAVDGEMLRLEFQRSDRRPDLACAFRREAHHVCADDVATRQVPGIGRIVTPVVDVPVATEVEVAPSD
jgi:hypothetical protein